MTKPLDTPMSEYNLYYSKVCSSSEREPGKRLTKFKKKIDEEQRRG